jgi:hypothetical protein
MSDIYQWYVYDNPTFTQHIYGTMNHKKGCVISEKKDGFTTGSIEHGEISRVEKFNSIEAAKWWVEQQVAGFRCCPNCGHRYKEES